MQARPPPRAAERRSQHGSPQQQQQQQQQHAHSNTVQGRRHSTSDYSNADAATVQHSHDAYVRSSSAITAAVAGSRHARPTEPAAIVRDAHSEHGGASNNSSGTVAQQQQQQQRSSGKEQGLAAEWGFTDTKVAFFIQKR
jgi:hypothetical protein